MTSINTLNKKIENTSLTMIQQRLAGFEFVKTIKNEWKFKHCVMVISGMVLIGFVVERYHSPKTATGLKVKQGVNHTAHYTWQTLSILPAHSMALLLPRIKRWLTSDQ